MSRNRLPYDVWSSELVECGRHNEVGGCPSFCAALL